MHPFSGRCLLTRHGSVLIAKLAAASNDRRRESVQKKLAEIRAVGRGKQVASRPGVMKVCASKMPSSLTTLPSRSPVR